MATHHRRSSFIAGTLTGDRSLTRRQHRKPVFHPLAEFNADGAREVFGIPDGVRPSAVNLMTNPNRFQ
jgi:hypothetical protein